MATIESTTYRALTSDLTITLLASETATEKQAKIDAAPHVIARGAALTFQFEAGETHTTGMDATIVFDGFNGSIRVRGNTSDTVPYNPGTTNPSTIIEMDAGHTAAAIRFSACTNVLIDYLWIKVPSGADYVDVIRFNYCPYASARYLVSEPPDGESYNFGAYYGSNLQLRDCWTSYGYCGAISGLIAEVLVYNCNDRTDNSISAPQYGQYAYSGTIMKQGTYFDGSIDDDLAEYGGEIR